MSGKAAMMGYLSILLAMCIASVAALDVTLFVSDVDPTTNTFQVTADSVVDITGFQFEVVDQDLNPLTISAVDSITDLNVQSNENNVLAYSLNAVALPAGQGISLATITLDSAIGDNDVCITNIYVTDSSDSPNVQVVADCGGSEKLNGDVQLFVSSVDSQGRANVSFISTSNITGFQFNVQRTDGLNVMVTSAFGGLADDAFDQLTPLSADGPVGGVIAFSSEFNSILPTSTPTVLVTIETPEASGLVICLVSSVFSGDQSKELVVIEPACIPPLDVSLFIDNVDANGEVDVLIQSFVAITGFEFSMSFSNGSPVTLTGAVGGLASSFFGNSLTVSGPQGRVSALVPDDEPMPAQETQSLLVTVTTSEIEGTSLCLKNSNFNSTGGNQASVLEPSCVQTSPSNVTLTVSPLDSATNTFTISITSEVAIGGLQLLVSGSDNSGNSASVALSPGLSSSPFSSSLLFEVGAQQPEVALVSLNPLQNFIQPGEDILIMTLGLPSATSVSSVCIQNIVISDVNGVALSFQVICGGPSSDVTLEITAVSESEEVTVLMTSSVPVSSFTFVLNTFNAQPANILSVSDEGVAQQFLAFVTGIGNTVTAFGPLSAIPSQNNGVLVTLGVNQPVNSQLCIEGALFLGSSNQQLSVTLPSCQLVLPSPPPPKPPAPPSPPAPPMPPMPPMPPLVPSAALTESSNDSSPLVSFFLRNTVPVLSFKWELIDLSSNSPIPISNISSTNGGSAFEAGFNVTFNAQTGVVTGIAVGDNSIPPSDEDKLLLVVDLGSNAPPSLCAVGFDAMSDSSMLIELANTTCENIILSPSPPSGFGSPPVTVDFIVPPYKGNSLEVQVNNEIPFSGFTLEFDTSTVLSASAAASATWKVVGGRAQELGYVFSPSGTQATLDQTLQATPPNSSVEYPASSQTGQSTIMLEIEIDDPSNTLTAGDEICLGDVSVVNDDGITVNAVVTCGNDIPPSLDPLVILSLQQAPFVPQVQILVSNESPITQLSLTLFVGGQPLDLSSLGVSGGPFPSPLTLNTSMALLSKGIISAKANSGDSLPTSSTSNVLVQFAQPSNVAISDIVFQAVSVVGLNSLALPFQTVVPPSLPSVQSPSPPLALPPPEGLFLSPVSPSPPPDMGGSDGGGSSSSNDGGLSTLEIIAIAIGGTVLLMLIVILSIFFTRRGKGGAAPASTTHVRHVEMTEEGAVDKARGDPSEPTGGGPLSVRVAGRG